MSYVKTMIQHHEAFKKEATKAGKSIEDYAKEHENAKGMRGHQARMHKTLGHLMKGSNKVTRSTLASNAHPDHGERYNG